METVVNILVWLAFGLVAGGLAKFIMPGRDPGGILTTMILGVLGSIVGGFIGNAVGFGGISGLDWRSLLLAVGGAFLLLLAYRAILMLTGAETPGSAQGFGGYGVRASDIAADAPAAVNVVDVAKKALNNDVIEKLSTTVGESASKTRKALEAMIPTVLAGVASQASTSSGASRLFDMAKDAAGSGVDLTTNLASHLTDSGIEGMGRTAQGTLNTLFGDKLAGLLSWLMRSAGIKESAAASLLGVATNLVMNVLGKQIREQGLNLSGLISLLASQRGWLAKLLPAGVTEIPGLNSLADMGDRAGAAARGAVEYGERAGAAAAGAARGAYRETAAAARGATPWLSALLPLALLALAVVAFPFLMRAWEARAPRAVVRGPEVRTPEIQTPEIRTPEVKAPDVRVSNYEPPAVKVPDLANLVQVKLPDGANLEIPKASFLNGVHKFLADATDTKPREFVFENLNFEGGTVKAAPETQTSVQILSLLLKAFPGVRLRIESHTDNMGDATTSRRVSLERANAVKDLLVKAGVPAERVTAEGFGSEKPIAPNDTDEGRAKNRRIELVVVKQ
jgi:outer membrane protein OmpA-like peptidoglycan-associated protein/uncharacterized membrane protein YeaQ/YmgE (transglycosylase-associated protein family)